MKVANDRLVIQSTQDRVLTLTLNRPPAHPLSRAMIAQIQEALDAAAADKDLRVIILTGPGRVFCAGHDLKEMAAHRADPDGGRGFLDELFRACEVMMQSITMHPKPVIAKVDGVATAAGCQLVAACDMAYASDRSTFCTPGVKTGGFCSTPLVAIGRNMHRKHAIEMALTGDDFDADDALRFGLINKAMPADQLDDFVRDIAEKMAKRSPITMSKGKQAFYEQIDMPLAEAYRHARAAMIEHFMTHDAEEGKRAFFEGREPVFRGE